MQTTWLIMGLILTAVGGYVFTSIVLLKFPTLLHKKKKRTFKATHISHRGGAGENLENTLTAFKHAENVGTDMLEIDCHITSDGEVVVMHDNNLQRSTGKELKVTETGFKELPPLQSTLRLDFQQNFVCVSSCDDRHIPLLREVFLQFPNMPINVDIKVDNDLLIDKISELIKEFKRESITVWGNRNSKICDKLYKHNPTVGLFFSMKRVLVTTLLFYTGLLPFIPMRETHYEMLMPSIAFKKDKFGFKPSRTLRFLLRVADFICMSKIMFSHLKARGVQVYLWVLNEEDEFERAFKLGADGVMTDFPTKLDQFLSENPQYRNANN